MTAMPDYIGQRIRRPVPSDSCVVPGSTPVVAFGNARSATVATLGLNPSKNEFRERNGNELVGTSRRLATHRSLGMSCLANAPVSMIEQVLQDCDTYFQRKPYHWWFDQLEMVLQGCGTSYYDGSACHLDLVQWATNPTWRKAQLLLVGAILTPGQRTVAAALRVMGRSDQRDYARYHEVLNRAVWSPREAAGILLVLLLQHLDRGDGPLVFGIDETLERRRGAKIKGRGICRDAVRSSRQQLVEASGLRWISLMWLGHVPWAGRHWALPVLTVLAPSARYYQQRGRRHKKLTDWARQMILQLRRWLPQRPLVLVGDDSYAVLDLLHCCQSLAQPVTLIARLRLDAALYAPAPPRQPGQNGRPPLKGPRRPSLKALLDQANVTWASATVDWYDGTTRTVDLTSQTAVWYRSGKPPSSFRWVLIRDPQGAFTPQALLCTDPAADPTQILEWFVLRWQLEVTFQEVRTHLGVETQRQWSDLAIARTTPVLLGLFSWTTLAAHALQKRRPMTQRRAA